MLAPVYYVENQPNLGLNRKPLKKFESMKNMMYDYAYDSTVHSMRHIIKPKNVLIKIFWIICLLISCTACSSMITLAIMNYFKYETVTKAETVFEVPTPFPAVSVCNMNPYSTRKAFDFVQNILTMNNLNNLSTLFSYGTILSEFMGFRYAVGVNLRSSSVSDEFRKQMGFQLNDMFLSCTYNQKACDYSNFFWFFDTLYGYLYENII